MSSRFEHQRHKPPQSSAGAGQLVIACPPMRSKVNLSRIIRAAGCAGVREMLCCGAVNLDPKITRDATQQIQIHQHRTLVPVLKRWKAGGYRVVGLEQTTHSVCLFNYRYRERTLLVVGNERTGLDQTVLDVLDDVVEIPVYGLPYSHNVATATAIAMYEYCRQYPDG